MTRCLVLGAWYVVATASNGAAQSDTSHPHARRADFLPLLGLGAAAALVLPADQWLAQTVRRPQWIRSGFGHDAANVVSFVGGNGPLAAGALMYVYGWQSKRANTRDAGLHVSQSMVAAAAVTGALKFALGRARPYVSSDGNSHDFNFGRGWRNEDYQSMPSGHSTVAFAFAAALSEERARTKGRSRAFDALVYGGATLVALSRMALDKHWASDVLLGAGIGVTSGLVTVRLAH